MTITAVARVAEYLDIDGVPLHSYGWGCQSLGSVLGTPPMRGEDAQFAGLAGREFRTRLPDSYTVSLAMWAIGASPADGVRGNQQLRWADNWQYLRNLLWTPDRQLALTRRWRLTNPTTGLGVMQTATAKVQLASPIQPRMTGRTRNEFTVDLWLADPFYYSAEVSTTIAVGATETITNVGDYTAAERHLFVDLVGPLTNPTLTNATPNPDVWVRFGASISTGHTVTLDVREFAATSTVAVGGSTNRIGAVSHGGAHQWMGLLRAGPTSVTNAVTLTADSGAGHAVLRFRPPHI